MPGTEKAKIRYDTPNNVSLLEKYGKNGKKEERVTNNFLSLQLT